MAYKIEYSPENAKYYPAIRNEHRLQLRWLICITIVLITILLVKIYGLPDCLIPGDAEVTKAAATNMVKQVQDGAMLQDAVVGFCREIINNA